MTADLPVILLAALLASASPGPATLAIADTSMRRGRRYGLAVAAGVTTGSLGWSVAAALGLGAVMAANAWLFEILRVFGALYLLVLAYRSARGALAATPPAEGRVPTGSAGRAYLSGLLLHLTNPKAILFFGSLYAIGLDPWAPAGELGRVIVAVGLQSAVVFHAYALLFSAPRVANIYRRLRRVFEAAFAFAFGVAGLRVLTARVG